MFREPLPIQSALPELRRSLSLANNAVLVAPPGAGKTTTVPLALYQEEWAEDRRILMLEPRRVAARAAAERMSETIGEKVGETVGYRIRDERKVSDKTRIEVVTEGILTRMLQSDPELSGIACVIFDEFHERSIHADLGLALCLETQSVLRDDLRLLAMSATLDAEAVVAVMGNAPVIRSEGRMFPVETRWLEKPWKTTRPARDVFETAVAETIKRALFEEQGDALVFLPGVGEINRVHSKLEGIDALLCPLHGGMPFAKQRAALRPDAQGKRRVVLSTAIAETSLTIEGVRIVIDGGLSRQPRFDAGAGMTRLITARVSKAAAEQRRGRAGRREPGVCYRLWTKGEEGGLPAQDRPEILDADLAPLALELAVWGIRDPAELSWIDTPPDNALDQAQSLLRALGALSAEGSITAHGKAIAKMPLHPRLAHMLRSSSVSGRQALASDIAALLEERDVLSGAGSALSFRVEALRDPKRYASERIGTIDKAVLSRVTKEAARLRKLSKYIFPAKEGRVDPEDVAAMIALAYPDRIAARRKGDAPRYVMTGGKGAVFADESDALANEPFLAVAHLDGNPKEGRIRLAEKISRTQIETLFADSITDGERCIWDTQTNTVSARRQKTLGAIILEDRPLKNASKQSIACAALEGVKKLGLDVLPWAGEAEQLRARLHWLSGFNQSLDLPVWSDEALFESLEEWLLPHLGTVRAKTDFDALPLATILRDTLSWEQLQKLDEYAPAKFLTPAGNKAKIDYMADPPALEVRIQEMFGETRHPSIGRGAVPLTIRFLSPARRPVQVTSDLPGFWQNSYSEVRKDLRGRYPKHPWPEDPLLEAPTARVKPRKR